MYYGLSMYFKNGGGSCYVISVGDYGATPAKADFEAGLKPLAMEDEPTLIVLLDAINLGAVDYYDLCQQALEQCEKLGDRFLILDVLGGDVPGCRNKIGTSYLMYGAAYHPYLQTTLNYQYQEEDIEIANNWQGTSGEGGVLVTYTGSAGTPSVKFEGGTADVVDFDTSTAGMLTIKIPTAAKTTGANIADAWKTWKNKNQPGGFEIGQKGDGGDTISSTGSVKLQQQTLASIRTTQTELYNQIKAAMNNQRVELPPSPAIAGIYARVDRERGVWKAPANVSIASVIGPVSKITHDDQENLNVDPTAGKSINAIRDFSGKGTLVWGGRTLAGNDNEWRYISVRRLFITIEESTRKATAFAVFEPNDATTWLKVKAMIESYLYGLWEQGALAGSKPESAYFVNVGLGKTMTAQDILEGRMIVEIGIAAVRPAEFIILRFTHKMQEA